MENKSRKDAAELTVRGTILGAVITVVFMAANVYLGLKTGMTFSSSIPAAILSMSALRFLGSSGILENNIVQTQASAAGTLCNVILVLPGLILISFWHGFPLWQTMAVCLLGGLLGVAYSIPLRRVMVVKSDLPFPEGVAAAEVLHAGHRDAGGETQNASETGLRELGISATIAALLNLVATGFKLLPDKIIGAVAYGPAVFRLGCSLSLALIGVGYLIRIGACLALCIGLFIAWGVAVPILMTLDARTGGATEAAAEAIWSEKVRLIGAGMIASGGLWTVATLIRPMIESVSTALKAENISQRERQDRDIPIIWVGAAIAILSLCIAALFTSFAAGDRLSIPLIPLVLAVTVLTVVLGLLMASACGYLAALLGSSASPISGFGILTTILVATGFAFAYPHSSGDGSERFAVALTLFMTSLIVTAASISNDNLQDLKTGQLVGAVPWRQQAALVIGVAVGAVTIGPVLELLYNAYGFAGALPRAGMNPRDAMPAPQAALMTQIATGIVQGKLDWTMIYIGAGLGIVFIGLESRLRRRGFSLPALTVGIGIYLPASVSVTIALGGVIGWFTERAVTEKRNAANVRHRGVLIASGFLVGESIAGVFIAASDALAGRTGSLAFTIAGQSTLATIIGIFVFGGLLAGFYRSTVRPA